MLKTTSVPHELSSNIPWEAGATDRVAFGDVYRDHVRYVWRCLNHLGVRPADLEDVTHDVFIVVGRKLQGFEGRSTLRTWIYGICLRTASDYRARAVHRREIYGIDVPEEATQAAQQSGLEDQALRDQLRRLLDLLPSEQREVFVLYEVEELPMKEVATAVGCPLQTAYSRLHAARKALRLACETEGVTSGG